VRTFPHWYRGFSALRTVRQSHSLQPGFTLRLDVFGTLPLNRRRSGNCCANCCRSRPTGDALGGQARAAIASAGRRAGLFHRCSCGRPIPEGVRRCSSRTCPKFAPIWARDTRRRLLVNLEQLQLSVMFSVTAPGADVYPFDARFCSHAPGARCSGVAGCRVNPHLAAAFNKRAGGWWSELHRAAKARADRATGFKVTLAARTDANGATLASVEAYSAASNSWSYVASMPTARSGLGVTAGSNGLVYALGGSNGAALNTNEVYTPSSNSWATLAPMPNALAGVVAATGTDGRIYAIGGRTVEVYTPSSNSWQTVAQVPSNVGYAGSATAGKDGRIYIMGQANFDCDCSTQLAAYTPSTNTWQACPNAREP
jgi:hypothetical protein